MRRSVFVVLAIVWGVLTLAAILASLGVVTGVGMWAHFVPAGAIYSAAEAVGLHVSPGGVWVRSAHGPPFLGPLGVIVCYVLPTCIFTVLAAAHKHHSAGRTP